MAEDMSDIMEKINSMLNSNNMPDGIKDAMNGLSNSNSTSDTSSAEDSKGGLNITPEMISSFMSSFGNSNNTTGTDTESSQQDNSTMPNIDMDTMLKITSAMGKMNNKDDPRSRLLGSLKPYLRNERREKIDQYVKFLNMGKMIEVFNLTGGGKTK